MHHDRDPSNINGWQIRKIDRLRVGNVQAMQGRGRAMKAGRGAIWTQWSPWLHILGHAGVDVER
jgi:hypothetical protein